MTRSADLILMCGLSFSGKSTFARLLGEQLGAAVISLDSINEERGLLGGRGIPAEEWMTTHRIAEERVSARLRAGADIVLDDTGSPRFVREHWRDIANREGARFALVWVQIDPELQRERLLANRVTNTRNDVTDAVMAEHVANFEPPIGEDPIVIDAHEAGDQASVRKVVEALGPDEWTV